MTSYTAPLPTIKQLQLLAECVGAEVVYKREDGLRWIVLYAPQGYRWTTVKDLLGPSTVATFPVWTYTNGPQPLPPKQAAIRAAYDHARGGLSPVPGREDLPPLQFPEFVRLEEITRSPLDKRARLW